MMTSAQIQAAEARRRLQLLGTTIEDTRGVLLGMRARQVGIPVAQLLSARRTGGAGPGRVARAP